MKAIAVINRPSMLVTILLLAGLADCGYLGGRISSAAVGVDDYLVWSLFLDGSSGSHLCRILWLLL